MKTRRHNVAIPGGDLLVRNYKHELRLATDEPRSILNYTDEVWETLCRQVAAHGFTGLVLYPGTYHPFEHVLDYAGFPEAASQPAALCLAKRNALNRGLGIAHRHGLQTFLQHYISHIPKSLSAHLQVGATVGGRNANLSHPEVDRYMQWVYRETFAQLPDLDGLYFNFESSQDMRHIENTAVREWNRMRRKPVAVWRVWGINQPEEFCRVVQRYRGTSILCHKGADTNDVYYLPVADSRVRDWKRLLPRLPFIFEIGPCHNCGTNLCHQLWADYRFVQRLLDDAFQKGANGVSFHSVHEFFAPDVATAGVFGEMECTLARLNYLHLLAVADSFTGRRRGRRERTTALASRNCVTLPAAAALLTAIEASSQLVLLAFRQFCYGSANEGIMNPGWYSHIQEPFFFRPATGLNGQTSSLAWRPSVRMCWINKQVPAEVCPENEYQYILDEADPRCAKANWTPRRIAVALAREARVADHAGRRYARLAGHQRARIFLEYLGYNAMAGDYFRREILAGRDLFALYFARTPQRLRKLAVRGLAQVQALAPLLARDAEARKKLLRVAMIGLDPASREVPPIRELVQVLQSPGIPFEAFGDYVESHRHYNEIRRLARPQRVRTPAALAVARHQIDLAIETAARAVARLAAPGKEAWRERVQAWLDFLLHERQHMAPPRLTCAASPGPAHALMHDHCFRDGEHFSADFLGFFRPVDWLHAAGISFRVWRTARALVVSIREDQVDLAARLKRWDEFAGTSDDSFVTQIHVDAQGLGNAASRITVYPRGSAVTIGNSADLPDVRRKFQTGRDWWEVTVWLPFRLLGRKPTAGQIWGLNVTANPFIQRGTAYTFAPQYDSTSLSLYGRMKFVEYRTERQP